MTDKPGGGPLAAGLRYTMHYALGEATIGAKDAMHV